MLLVRVRTALCSFVLCFAFFKKYSKVFCIYESEISLLKSFSISFSLSGVNLLSRYN